ncbi:AAA family ATPase [Brachybacterium hainanense]|uniref:AAA family ATPase n=1 Tax=Brachybacterium hainanense TaxID=1541174 RepID=A0ABV6R946_9MICO
MNLRTRKPTGRPPWPTLLLAGASKAGKTYACAEASASELVPRTYWLGIGEPDPDMYGAIPNASFEIVEHDGSWRGIGQALAAINAQGESLLVVDSMTRLWDLLKDEAQALATIRAREKNRRNPDEAKIDMDLWNRAKERHAAVVTTIQQHQGPVLMTARLDVVTAMDDRGQPTRDKDLKIQTEKNLPYEVDGVILMPERGKARIDGLRSMVWQIDRPTDMPGFTLDGLWRRLGLGEQQTAPAVHRMVRGAESATDQSPADRARDELRIALRGDRDLMAAAVQRFAEMTGGDSLKETTDDQAVRDLIAAMTEQVAA